jgi:spermidine/putrescine transport system permease protein
MSAAASRAGRVSLGAWFGVVLVLLYAPLAVIVLFSFADGTVTAFPVDALTTRWYRALADDSALRDAVWLSARIGVVGGALATALGLAAAIGLSSPRLRLRPVLTAVLVLPLVVPAIVLAIGMVVLLREGGLGGSAGAVVAGHVVLALPYAVLVILPRLQALDGSLTEAARDLGCGALGAFARVSLPLLAPALLSSFVVAFTISFDEYAVASFLIPPGERTLPIYVYGSSKVPDQRPELLALAAVVISVSLLLVGASEVARRGLERRQRGAAAVPS